MQYGPMRILVNLVLTIVIVIFLYGLRMSDYVPKVLAKINLNLWNGMWKVDWNECKFPVSLPFISGDTFRCMADYVLDERTGGSLSPEWVPSNSCVIVFVKTDYIFKWFELYHLPFKNTGGYILLTSRSDFAIPSFFGVNNSKEYLKDAWLIHWFAVNIDSLIPKISHLPLGLEDLYYGRQKPSLYRPSEILPLNRSSRVLINFSPFYEERKEILRILGNSSFVTVSGKAVNTELGQLSFIDELREHQIVISPPGNGLDCHRSWEAFSCGNAIIVKHSTLDDLYEGMPVILIDSWLTVTEEWLDAQLLKMLDSDGLYRFAIKKHLAVYWQDIFAEMSNRTPVN